MSTLSSPSRTTLMGAFGDDVSMDDKEDAANKAATQLLDQQQREMAQSFRTASGFHRNQHVGVYLANPPDESEGEGALRQWQVATFMDTPAVRTALLLVIVANAITIGVQDLT